LISSVPVDGTVLAINGAVFLIEIGAGAAAGSANKWMLRQTYSWNWGF
jgi:hypothetical protein